MQKEDKKVCHCSSISVRCNSRWFAGVSCHFFLPAGFCGFHHFLAHSLVAVVLRWVSLVDGGGVFGGASDQDALLEIAHGLAAEQFTS